MNLLAVLFALIAIFSLGYGVVIVSYSGVGTAFLWFWIVTGIVSVIIAVIARLLYRQQIVVGRHVTMGFSLVLVLGTLLFLFVEGTIIYQGSKKPDSGADYIIVLGAQVRGSALSKALKSRLDTAYEYLQYNENTLVIVSGGQGSGEDISEAEAMMEYLVQLGIKEDRIIKEEQSTNTYENLKFSKEQVSGTDQYFVLVTNSFHVFRATSIAKKLGFANIKGLGAPNRDLLALHYYMREFFAVIKDKLVGNF